MLLHMVPHIIEPSHREFAAVDRTILSNLLVIQSNVPSKPLLGAVRFLTFLVRTNEVLLVMMDDFLVRLKVRLHEKLFVASWNVADLLLLAVPHLMKFKVVLRVHKLATQAALDGLETSISGVVNLDVIFESRRSRERLVAVFAAHAVFLWTVDPLVKAQSL